MIQSIRGVATLLVIVVLQAELSVQFVLPLHALRPSKGQVELTAKNTASGGSGFGSKASTPLPPKQVQIASTNEVFKIGPFELPSSENVNTMFMGAFMIDDKSVCDDLVSTFEANPSAHKRGYVVRDGKAVVDESRKESLEISFLPNDPTPAWRRYVTCLQQIMPRYVEKYPFSANYVGAWGLSSPTNFQYYPPGGGFKVYHTERKDRSEPGRTQIPSAMT